MEGLSNELLFQILRGCDGKTVINCRRVCTRLKEVVDLLNDGDWKWICRQENEVFLDYKIAHAKHGLSWRDTYKALNSWSKIGSSQMTVKLLCEDKFSRFRVLPKGIVSVLKSLKNSSAVVYYDTETLEELNREVFPFESTNYEENEYILVVLAHDRFCIVVKETGERDIIMSNVLRDSCSLVGKQAYCWKSSDRYGDAGCYVYTLTQTTVVKEELRALNDQPCIVCVNDGEKYFLRQDNAGESGTHILRNSDFACIERLDLYQHDSLIKLKRYGFDWQTLYKLSGQFEYYLQPSIYFESKAVFCHGKVVLTSDLVRSRWRSYINVDLKNYDKVVHINYPHTIKSARDIKKVITLKHKRIIFTKEIQQKKVFDPNPDIHQLDIIETSNKHKILILLSGYLYIVEFPIE